MVCCSRIVRPLGQAWSAYTSQRVPHAAHAPIARGTGGFMALWRTGQNAGCRGVMAHQEKTPEALEPHTRLLNPAHGIFSFIFYGHVHELVP